MQCPECNHVPLAGTQPDPTRCPECGIYYAKAAWLRKGQVPAGTKPKPPAVKVSDAYGVQQALRNYPGAQPVVVIDVQMSFNSMVWFMVKWALASIPALIILFILFLIMLGIIGGLGRFL